MFLPSAGSAAAAQAAQAAAVASVTQQQLQLQTAAQHINNVGVANVNGQTQVGPLKKPSTFLQIKQPLR